MTPAFFSRHSALLCLLVAILLTVAGVFFGRREGKTILTAIGEESLPVFFSFDEPH